MLGAEHAVEERALIEVGRLRINGPAEDIPGELEHVVRDAALLGVRAEFGRELTHFSLVVLTAARSAGAEGALLCHFVPEVRGDIAGALVASELISPRSGDDLRNRRVRMDARECVAPLGERDEDAFVVEATADVDVRHVMRDRREVVERFSHSAKLGTKDRLHRGIVERCDPVARPTCHLFRDIERLRVAAERVRIEHAGQDLVDGIERCPHTAPAGLEPVEQLFRKRAEVPVGHLALRQLGDHEIPARLDGGVTELCGEQRTPGEIVANEVAAQFVVGGFPAVVRLRCRWPSGGDTE